MIAGFDRLLCKEIEAQKKTEGGIVLPDSAQGNICVARVTKVGYVTEDGPESDVFDGSTVWFDRAYATEIKFRGDTFLVVAADCVLAAHDE